MSISQDERAINLGQILQGWREQQGLTRPEMVTEVQKLGVSLSANYLAKLELGFRPLANASLDIREALRTILGISEEEWRRQTDLYVPLQTDETSQQLENTYAVCFPVLSSASVSHPQAEPFEDRRAYIPTEHLRDADPQRVQVFLAQDNCLVSQSIQTSASGIRASDYVAVETERSPQPDDIVVVFDEEAQKLVLRREVETDAFVIFCPIDGSGPPIVQQKEQRLPRLGVVIWRGGSV